MTDEKGFKHSYESLWETKLKDRQWLENDGKGRVAYCAQFILRHLSLTEQSRILDVGCGRGTLNYFLKCDAAFYGVDISEVAANAAREVYHRVDVVDLNTEPLPHDANTFDVAVALDVIEHVMDPRFFVRELHRTLKPGGYLIVSTPNILNEQLLKAFVRTRRFPKTSGDAEPYDGGHIHFFTYRDVFDLLKKCGFKYQAIGPAKDAFDFEFKESMVWVLAQKTGEANV